MMPFESLESRSYRTVTLSGGVLSVTGTSGNDSGSVIVKSGDSAHVVVTLNGGQETFVKSSITSMSIQLGDGNDTFKVDESNGTFAGIDATWNLGNGNDRGDGGSERDTIGGGAGNDYLLGGGGADSLDGGLGDDDMTGGIDTAPDTFAGGAGDDDEFNFFDEDITDENQEDAGINTLTDLIKAKPGTVTLSGGIVDIQGTSGDDHAFVLFDSADSSKIDVRLNGKKFVFDASAITHFNCQLYGGHDVFHFEEVNGTFAAYTSTINTGSGRDFVHGGSGADLIILGTNNDAASGWPGDDSMYGQDGNDAMWGWNGADLMDGGNGNDFLHGDDENDTFRGGAGADTLEGNGGDDLLDAGVDSAADDMTGDNFGTDTGHDHFINYINGQDTIFDLQGNDLLN